MHFHKRLFNKIHFRSIVSGSDRTAAEQDPRGIDPAGVLLFQLQFTYDLFPVHSGRAGPSGHFLVTPSP